MAERIYPHGLVNLLPEADTQPLQKPAGLVLHTAVDAPGPTDLQRYFARGDVGAESTFWLPLDGTVVQMMYVGQRADATGSGNRWYEGSVAWGFDSIETEDEGRPEEVPWTDAQVEALVDLMVWYVEEWGVPAQIANAPRGRGFGFHSMWGRDGIWGPVTRGITNPWTKYQGKTCPGNRRVAQMKDEVWPAVLAELDTKKPAGELEKELDEMVEIWMVFPDGTPGRDESRPYFFVGPWGGVQIADASANSIAATYRQLGHEIVRNLTKGSYDLQRGLVESSMRAQAAKGVDPVKVAKAVVDELVDRLTD